MTSINVYVPLLIYGREKYEYNANTAGVFINKSDAVNALVKHLIKNENLILEIYTEEIYDEEKEEQEHDEEKYIQMFEEYLLSRVNGDFDELIKVCNEYSNSYFKDGWDIRIDNHNVIM